MNKINNIYKVNLEKFLKKELIKLMLNNNLRTLCVILHYGSENLTNECIKSLINNKFTNIDVVVSDNDPSHLINYQII